MRSRTARWGMIGLVILLAFGWFGGLPGGRAYAADEYDAMREARKAMLTGGGTLDTADPDIAAAIAAATAAANGYWQTMNTSASRTYLWSDNSGMGNSIHIRVTYERLRAMALAYSTSGSALFGNAQLKTDIVSALDYMYSTRYNEAVTTTPSGTSNWWDWQIGIPMQLNDTVVLMYSDLSSAQVTNYMKGVEHFSPAVNLSGANRSWKAFVVAIRGILVKDGAKIAAARDGLSAIFAYTQSGDGFYRDGSFIQHSSIPYTGGYGLDLLLSVGNLMKVLNGSSWQVSDPGQSNVWDWVYNAYQPLMYKGAMMDIVRGREISRYYSQDHTAGHAAMQGILMLADIAPPAQSSDFKSMIKGWLQSDTFLSFYADAPIPSIVQAKAIAADSGVAPAAELLLYKQYSAMDRAVQHRPGYSLGLGMFSNRISSFEAINSENNKGWYTSAGITSLYNADLGQFSDGYWPTVDSYRLPGTTVLSQTSSVSQKSPNTWTGGTDMLNLYGVSGMDLQYTDHTLKARKSWFMFDDEAVALGAGIASTDGLAVETIAENRRLNAAGSNAFTVNGTAQPAALGWNAALTGVNWAHLSGNAAGADIGYYFPQAASLQAKREARTGNWKQVNGRSETPSTPITRNYLTLWFDHGQNPQAAGYEYVLLPNKTAAQVAGYAAQPDIQILANNEAVQAVRENRLGIVAANFWTDGGSSADLITVSKKAAVMVKETGSESLEVSVSDPTQANTGVIEVELDRSADEYTADTGITVTQLSPTVKFTVNVNAAKGKTFKAAFGLGEGGGTPQPVQEIIVDNSDASGVTKTGGWKTASTQTDRYGSSYLHDDNAGKGSKSVTFTPDLPATATYAVYMMWPQHENRASSIPVEITHAGGTAAAAINQTSNGGIWNLLGTYTFNAGASGSVTIRNEGTTGYVVADAVKFVLIP
ncbi:polysaccharide lyase family 8 super-sandwich domain-containing protein [Paenibacillus sp. S150]|uniref:polysaccharide lyase family 8 super-sandwich domain-containing protein n=1 Tax=Paenibacillus sp. S150 TaxID=2749826 RepID=UPI001C566991|nr:polysaccharide lyase family 8 super-sandwich domain-containing protein [Paenibacillus sp. S150]MBW4084158.1 hyaluronate lyase [Paenibacillus sp. S150]